ncbi:MAG: ABC transporter substrate-binding protein [Deltaproteobacteria bacterium]|nr:ABC transporter substrate-binding protein [Deltaproteobacteria bacterium]
MKTKNILIIVVSFVFAITLIVSQKSLAGESYNLGVALGLSGPGNLYSKDGLDAIKLAVGEINAQGGFLGKYPVKLYVRDTLTNPDVAAKKSKELIVDDNVRCILGTYSSACALAVKPITREHKVLHIAAISNSENITKKNFSPYTYSVVPNSYMQAKAVALAISRMAKDKNWKYYVTIASDYEWGHSTQKNFVEILKQASPGLELKEAFWPPLGETEFTRYAMKILKDNPSFVFGSLASKDNEHWLNQAKSLGFFDKVPYQGSLISVTELMKEGYRLPRGVIGVCRAPFFAHMDVMRMSNFVENFKARYGRYPSDWAVLEYDALYALKQGIDAADSIESKKVKDAMRGLTIKTTRGSLTFREIDNQLDCPSYVGMLGRDPQYPFPVYQNMIIVKGSESWRPEEEIREFRRNN